MQIINSIKQISVKNLPLAIVFFIALAFSWKFHFQYLSDFPNYIHAWSQTDWYAIALGFINNGFDFFHPQSFNLNPSCYSPKVWPKELEGITAVDFPIHHYVMAILMKITDDYSPFFPRLYVLIYAYVGFYFLYLFSKKILSANWLSIIFPLFVLSSPVFIYYQISFLPSIPSFSNTIIAYYFFFQFLDGKQYKSLAIAVLFFLLAAMPRTPFFIFFFASFCHSIYLIVISKQINKQALYFFGLGFLVFFGYYFYNKNLAETYGSIYLRNLLYAKSFDEIIFVVKKAAIAWGLHYLTTFHYYFLAFIAGLAALFTILKVKRPSFLLRNQLGFHLFIIWIGVLMYFILMLEQFKAHDYYFIDSFFIPIIFSLLFLMCFIPQNIISNIGFFIVYLVFTNNAFGENLDRQNERKASGIWDTAKYENRAYKGSDSFLNEIGIPKTAKMLALDTYSTNAVLILMNRKGFTQLFNERSDLEFALQHDFDFVVMNDLYIEKPILELMPELPSILNRINGNGKISLYKRAEKVQTKEEFLGFSGFGNQTTKYDFPNKGDTIEFEDIKEEFEPLKIIKGNKVQHKFIHKMKVNIDSDIQGDNDIFLCLSAKNKEEEFNYMYAFKDSKQNLGTNLSEFVFPIGMKFSQSDSIELYFWNPQKKYHHINSLQIELMHQP